MDVYMIFLDTYAWTLLLWICWFSRPITFVVVKSPIGPMVMFFSRLKIPGLVSWWSPKVFESHIHSTPQKLFKMTIPNWPVGIFRISPNPGCHIWEGGKKRPWLLCCFQSHMGHPWVGGAAPAPQRNTGMCGRNWSKRKATSARCHRWGVHNMLKLDSTGYFWKMVTNYI